MNKKYIVRLSQDERKVCTEEVKNLKGTSQKVRRAQILLKADADGPAWVDQKICEAFDCQARGKAHRIATWQAACGLWSLDPSSFGRSIGRIRGR